MDLEAELTEGEGFAGGEIRLDQGSERLEFPTLDIDFEEVDVGVTWEA